MHFVVVLLAIAAVSLAAQNSCGDDIVAAARAMIDRYPYSWCGGNDQGPTKGAVQKQSPYCDDRNVVGFDCSGLTKYAVYQATGKSIYHGATHQYLNCPNKVAIADKQPGDLMFYGNSLKDIHHVVIYSGGNNMIEAYGHDSNCHGIPVRETTIRTQNLLEEVARYC